MSNFAEDIERAALGAIEAIVVGPEGGWGDYGLDDMEPHIPVELRGVALSWDVARPWLDREYSTGFGAPSCWCITAWTADRVLFVSQYDGATSVRGLPRNPVDHAATMPGG